MYKYVSVLAIHVYIKYTMVPPLILARFWSPLLLHTPQAPHFPKFELDLLLVLRKETSKQYKITLQHHTFLAVYKYDKNSDLCLPSNLGSDWLVNPAHNIS